MGYDEFYLSKKISNNATIGKKVWLLKTPRVCDLPSGDSLLGSLVEEVEKWFEPDYPVPYHLTTPKLFLNAIEKYRNKLHIPDTANLVIDEDMANISFVLDRSNGISVETAVSLPGVPAKLGLGLDYSKVVSLKFTLGQNGSLIKYIPTDYLVRLSRQFKGKAEKIDSSVAVNIYANLIVDMIVVAKNYTIEFKMSNELAPYFSAEATAASVSGKISVKQKDSYSFAVDIKGDESYLIGIKTVDWDDLWDDTPFDW